MGFHSGYIRRMPTDTAPLRAVIYRRVSTARQSLEGVSLAAQYELAEARAAREGWDVVAVSTDVASGRSVRRRGGLAEAREILARGEADILLAAKFDRLSRSVADFATLLGQSQAEGWRVVVLDIHLDTSTAAGALTAQVLMAAAEYESRLCSERTLAAAAHLRRQGRTLGRRPNPVSDLDRRCAELHSSGLSWRQVCDRLEAEGVPPLSGAVRWYPQTVRRFALRAGVPV